MEGILLQESQTDYLCNLQDQLPDDQKLILEITFAISKISF